MRKINLPYFLIIIFYAFAAIPLFMLTSDWISTGLGYEDTLPSSMLVPIISLLLFVATVIPVATLVVSYNISSLIQALYWRRRGYKVSNLCFYPFWIRFDDKIKIQIKVSALLTIFLMPTQDFPQINFVEQDKEMEEYAQDYREASLWQLRTQLALMLLVGLVAGMVGQWVVAAYFFLLGVLILDLAFVEVPQCHGTLTRIRHIKSGGMGCYLYWQVIFMNGNKAKIYTDFQNSLVYYNNDALCYFKINALKHLFMEACLDDKISFNDTTVRLATEMVKKINIEDSKLVIVSRLDLLKALIFYALIQNDVGLIAKTVELARDLQSQAETSDVWAEKRLWSSFEALAVLGERKRIKWGRLYLFLKYRRYHVFDNYKRIELKIEDMIKTVCA